MRLDTLEVIARALGDADVSYLVAGGVAVNAHGYQRLTHDLDLVLDLEPGNVRRAIRALTGLGYRAPPPVAAEELADPAHRREWLVEKNMEVFSLASDEHRGTRINLFVDESFDFEAEYDRALVADLAAGVQMRFVGLQMLITMAEASGRPIDADDALHLRRIQELEAETPNAPYNPWDEATWAGARRAQLRWSLERTVRERLDGLEDLAETSRRLVEAGRAARRQTRARRDT